MVWRCAAWVADQARDVYLNKGEVVEVDAPRPDSCVEFRQRLEDSKELY